MNDPLIPVVLCQLQATTRVLSSLMESLAESHSGALDALQGTSDDIAEALGLLATRSAIKSVQRGIFTPTVLGGDLVTITAVNVSKTLVIASLDAAHVLFNTAVPQVGAVLVASNQIRVFGASSINNSADAVFRPVSWQVVEFN